MYFKRGSLTEILGNPSKTASVIMRL